MTNNKLMLVHALALTMLLISGSLYAKNIAYIHGDVSADGRIPSGNQAPYDQMLISDSGRTGLSQFKALVESQGHTISQHYDARTSLTRNFLNRFDVVIFGLHQKRWSNAEKNALDSWLRDGGGMLIYSDSASGGRFNIVGSQNNVGQRTVNNIIARYGMQVTVDQAHGVKAVRPGPSNNHPVVAGRQVLEGEGVSPIAVDRSAGVRIIIPYENNGTYRVSGALTLPHRQGITINNPLYASLALKPLGQGNLMVMFDRQPMWNAGPGSSINKRNNREILRRMVNFLASGDNQTPPPPPAADLEVQARAETLVTVSGTATLDGSIVKGSSSSNRWRKVSGPGTVNFASATSVDTTATFSQAGVYTLEFRAENSAGNAAKNVTINVVSDSAIVHAINAGGGQETSNTGLIYSADAFFSGGHIDNFSGAAVSGTKDDEVYNHARSQHSAYRLPVPNGDYLVLLQLSETFFTARNRRVFDVSIESRLLIDDLDLFATAPGKHSAYDVLLDTSVDDGMLDITFSASRNNALVNGIVVIAKNNQGTPNPPVDPAPEPQPEPQPEPEGIAIPGTIEAENYNEGGQGVGYFDRSTRNLGRAFRNDAVDIQPASEGGFNVGWIQSGEWLAYTVTVTQSGMYDFRARVATRQRSNKSLHIEIDGTDVTGPITFNTNGAGWQAWRNANLQNVFLEAGTHELRIVMDSDSFNLNYLEITPSN